MTDIFDNVSNILRRNNVLIIQRLDVASALVHIPEINDMPRQQIQCQLNNLGENRAASLFIDSIKRKPSSFFSLMIYLKDYNDELYVLLKNDENFKNDKLLNKKLTERIEKGESNSRQQEELSLRGNHGSGRDRPPEMKPVSAGGAGADFKQEIEVEHAILATQLSLQSVNNDKVQSQPEETVISRGPIPAHTGVSPQGSTPANRGDSPHGSESNLYHESLVSDDDNVLSSQEDKSPKLYTDKLVSLLSNIQPQPQPQPQSPMNDLDKKLITSQVDAQNPQQPMSLPPNSPVSSLTSENSGQRQVKSCPSNLFGIADEGRAQGHGQDMPISDMDISIDDLITASLKKRDNLEILLKQMIRFSKLPCTRKEIKSMNSVETFMEHLDSNNQTVGDLAVLLHSVGLTDVLQILQTEYNFQLAVDVSTTEVPEVASPTMSTDSATSSITEGICQSLSAVSSCEETSENINNINTEQTKTDRCMQQEKEIGMDTATGTGTQVTSESDEKCTKNPEMERESLLYDKVNQLTEAEIAELNPSIHDVQTRTANRITADADTDPSLGPTMSLSSLVSSVTSTSVPTPDLALSLDSMTIGSPGTEGEPDIRAEGRGANNDNTNPVTVELSSIDEFHKLNSSFDSPSPDHTMSTITVSGLYQGLDPSEEEADQRETIQEGTDDLVSYINNINTEQTKTDRCMQQEKEIGMDTATGMGTQVTSESDEKCTKNPEMERESLLYDKVHQLTEAEIAELNPSIHDVQTWTANKITADADTDPSLGPTLSLSSLVSSVTSTSVPTPDLALSLDSMTIGSPGTEGEPDVRAEGRGANNDNTNPVTVELSRIDEYHKLNSSFDSPSPDHTMSTITVSGLDQGLDPSEEEADQRETIQEGTDDLVSYINNIKTEQTKTDRCMLQEKEIGMDTTTATAIQVSSESDEKCTKNPEMERESLLYDKVNQLTEAEIAELNPSIHDVQTRTANRITADADTDPSLGPTMSLSSLVSSVTSTSVPTPDLALSLDSMTIGSPGTEGEPDIRAEGRGANNDCTNPVTVELSRIDEYHKLNSSSDSPSPDHTMSTITVSGLDPSEEEADQREPSQEGTHDLETGQEGNLDNVQEETN